MGAGEEGCDCLVDGAEGVDLCRVAEERWGDQVAESGEGVEQEWFGDGVIDVAGVGEEAEEVGCVVWCEVFEGADELREVV